MAILALVIIRTKRNSPFNPENFLPSVLKTINEAVIVVNPDFSIAFANTKSEKLLKYKNQELIGKKIDQFFENDPIRNNTIQEIFDTQTTQAPKDTKEINCIDAHNNKIPVTIAVKKVNDNSKRLIGFISILTDKSEIKNYLKTLEEKTREIEEKNDSLQKLQQELNIEKASVEEKVKQRTHDFEEEHARLLASINNLSLCFLMTDKYKNIILNNKTTDMIFPSLHTERETIEQLQQSEQVSIDLNEQVEKSLTEKRVINLADVQINFKFVNIFISPIVFESKQIPDAIGTVIIIEDKTQQHNLDRSKEDLFSIASHELRTPLTAISGYISLIKQIYFSNLQDENLKNIINNIGTLSKKLSMSINNFLDSSKLEQGKIDLRKDPCDLFATINKAIKEMEGIALEKNLYIKFDPPPSPIIIIGDQIRLMQILTILIGNAIKFTQIGGIYISIENKVNFAKITIQDTGKGITEENKNLLFRKFQQAGDNLLTRQEGTGLGLHIAKLLVEKMQGSIRLEKTEINKGSTFSFTIPTANN
jgi:PAS domain S-box-containing protein